MVEQLKIDVDNGLSSFPKTLPSKYFYDKIGDELFTKIMYLPEYYLTRAEFEIFKQNAQNIIDALQLKSDKYFELIEFGAGDGLKTKELLRILDKQGFKFDYYPIDISQNALDNLEKTINTELPNILINKKQGDYFKVIKEYKSSKDNFVFRFKYWKYDRRNSFAIHL